MKLYRSLLKVFGVLLLIPALIAITLYLGFFGFTLDFGNAFGSGASSAYLFILPLGFIGISGWLAYMFMKRKIKKLLSVEKIYQEQGMGTTPTDVAINSIRKNGSMTAQDLARTMNITQDESVSILRDLLQLGQVRQDASQLPSRYFVPQNDSYDG